MRLNGLDFHVEIDGQGPPLLLLHGFTGSVRAWDTIRPALAEFATLIAIDLIGHGGSASPRDSARYSLAWSTRDLSLLLDGLHLDSVDLLGYSMGGRVGLEFAVHARGRVKTLILESASPGIQAEAERGQRVATDAALAARIVNDGVAAFVAEWEGLPLLALAPNVPEAERARQTALRLRNNPLGLANSLRGMGAGQQTPLWPALPELDQRVALIVGERDSRYRQIAERMHALLPASEVTVVAGAGHAVHLDAPGTFVGLVKAALDDRKS